MTIAKTTTAALVLGLLISGAFAPAWSTPSTPHAMAVAEAGSSNKAVQSADFNRVKNDSAADTDCRPGHIYSAHNIVGHPQSCIRGTISGVDGTASTMVGAPAL